MSLRGFSATDLSRPAVTKSCRLPRKGLVMLATCLRTACVAALACASGCAMCTSCDDDTYSAYGGRWERLDSCFGRVGSAFTPEVGVEVGGAVGGEAESAPEEIMRPEPTPADNRFELPPQGDAPPSPETSILHQPSTIKR